MTSSDPKEVLPPEEFDKEVDALYGRAKAQRKKKNVAIIIASIAVAIAAFAAGTALAGREQAEELNRKVQVNAEKVEEANTYAREQREQFEYCKKASKKDPRCQRPVAPVEPVEPEKPTEPVKAGVSEDRVKEIVSLEVARRNLTLTPEQINTIATVAASKIPKPADGKTPTIAQLRPLVSVAVATFCANDACKGEDGVDGEDGTDAPPVTAEQLSATLTAYCETRNGCIGAKGEPGEDGEDVVVATEPIPATTDTPAGIKVTFSYRDGTVLGTYSVFNGRDGQPGRNAFPFTFTFVIPVGTTDPERTYDCTVENPTTPVNCQLRPPPTESKESK